jgi:TolA-binding protein
MKINGKNPKQSCSSRGKAFPRDLSSSYRTFGFFVLVCLLSPCFSASAISSGQPGPTSLSTVGRARTFQDANEHYTNYTSHTDFRDELWRARIGAPKNDKDEKARDELKQLIERIRSVEFRPQQETRDAALSEGGSTTEPNGASALSEKPNVPPAAPRESELPYKVVSSETLRIVKELCRQPSRIENPFELAEVLFLSGNLTEAAALYQEALNRQGADDGFSAQRRAWILFQAANCLRHDDMPAAKELYRQLIVEHPDSPWTDLAKAEDKLIDWYLSEKPWTLVGDSAQQKGISQDASPMRPMWSYFPEKPAHKNTLD